MINAEKDRQVHDHTGKRFGRLLVQSFAYSKDKHAYWHVLCDCGKTKIVPAAAMVKGDTVSCGCRRRRPRMTDHERLFKFIKKDPQTGCWLWQKRTDAFGYGRFHIALDSRKRGPRKFFGAHQYAYQLLRGPVPDGMCVLHHCDNPPCCNPNHLFLGTPADNMRDMIAKGRGAWQKDAARSRDGKE